MKKVLSLMRSDHADDTFVSAMYRRIFWPALAASLGQAIADMADGLLVGRSIGEVGLAAIGMTLPLFMLLNIFIYGLGIGGSVKFSQLMGEGKSDEARASFWSVMYAAIGFGLCVAVVVNVFPTPVLRVLGTVPSDGALYEQTLLYARLIALGSPLLLTEYLLNYYLLSDNQPRLAGIGLVVGSAADLGLNVLLVTVLGLGILGAGLATICGAALCIALYLPAIFRKSGNLHWHHGARMDWREAWACFKTGASTSSQYAYQILFLLIANHTLMALSGGTGVAVLDLVQNASYPIIYLYEAAAKALQPLAATFYGEKDRGSLRQSLTLSLRYGLALGALMAGLIALFPQAVCAAFGITEAAALQTGVPALRLYCLSSLFAGVSTLVESYCQAVERERYAFVIATLRGSAVLLPVTLLLSLFAPYAFWWLYPITEISSLLIFALWVSHKGLPTIRCDPAHIFSRRIHSRKEELSPLTQEIEVFCEAQNANPRQSYFVTMAVEELGLATIQKAFSGENGIISVTLIACEDGDFELHLRDNAAQFDPFTLHTEKVGRDTAFDMDAMGVLVVKKQAKSFFYREYQGFNTLVVRI